VLRRVFATSSTDPKKGAESGKFAATNIIPNLKSTQINTHLQEKNQNIKKKRISSNGHECKMTQKVQTQSNG
jgi:hypothetical protein